MHVWMNEMNLACGKVWRRAAHFQWMGKIDRYAFWIYETKWGTFLWHLSPQEKHWGGWKMFRNPKLRIALSWYYWVWPKEDRLLTGYGHSHTGWHFAAEQSPSSYQGLSFVDFLSSQFRRPWAHWENYYVYGREPNLRNSWPPSPHPRKVLWAQTIETANRILDRFMTEP